MDISELESGLYLEVSKQKILWGMTREEVKSKLNCKIIDGKHNRTIFDFGEECILGGLKCEISFFLFPKQVLKSIHISTYNDNDKDAYEEFYRVHEHLCQLLGSAKVYLQKNTGGISVHGDSPQAKWKNKLVSLDLCVKDMRGFYCTLVIRNKANKAKQVGTR